MSADSGSCSNISCHASSTVRIEDKRHK
ncbi:MAG: CxxxxCH/CxxCH domain-containing protein [Magnetococcales bacterium]|nr:CxxxxCH/CxxCH domain-containing protein [Magnetococcales bacterium]